MASFRIDAMAAKVQPHQLIRGRPLVGTERRVSLALLQALPNDQSSDRGARIISVCAKHIEAILLRGRCSIGLQRQMDEACAQSAGKVLVPPLIRGTKSRKWRQQKGRDSDDLARFGTRHDERRPRERCVFLSIDRSTCAGTIGPKDVEREEGGCAQNEKEMTRD